VHARGRIGVCVLALMDCHRHRWIAPTILARSLPARTFLARSPIAQLAHGRAHPGASVERPARQAGQGFVACCSRRASIALLRLVARAPYGAHRGIQAPPRAPRCRSSGLRSAVVATVADACFMRSRRLGRARAVGVSSLLVAMIAPLFQLTNARARADATVRSNANRRQRSHEPRAPCGVPPQVSGVAGGPGVEPRRRRWRPLSLARGTKFVPTRSARSYRATSMA
jgi:hypothetical protein